MQLLALAEQTLKEQKYPSGHALSLRSRRNLRQQFLLYTLQLQQWLLQR